MDRKRIYIVLAVLVFVSGAFCTDKKQEEPKQEKGLLSRMFGSDQESETKQQVDTNITQVILVPEKFRTLSEKESQLFLALVGEREKARQEKQVLGALLSEQKVSILKIRDEFQEEYKLPSTQKYVLSSKEWKLYEVDKDLNIGKVLHRFRNEKDYMIFSGQYYKMQDLLADYKHAKKMLLNAKVAYQTVAFKLEDGFNIKETEQYKYDQESGTIYVLRKKKVEK